MLDQFDRALFVFMRSRFCNFHETHDSFKHFAKEVNN